jgi:radical SAM superfamily enzyme YgiQ (UPF0313 family)
MSEIFSVSIVVPGWHYWFNPSRIQPVYELYFATVIESRLANEGVQVDLIDLRGVKEEQQIYHIPKRDVYLYWIPKSGDYPAMKRLVGEIRQAYPKARHAAGGTHIDLFPHECAGVFDTVVNGPGEESFISIIQDCRKNRLRKNYKTDYKDVPYADYPFMRRHYLPETAVVNNLLFEKYGDDIRATCVLFSRGCTFRCKFCVYNVPPFIQMRSFESIHEEIAYLKKEYAISAINLKDEICIPIERGTALSFLQTLKNSSIMWRGQTTVAGITEEKMAAARESGCVELAVGVESASEKVLEIIDKRITLGQVRNFMQLCKKYGIKIKMCLILGLPGEPADIVQRTISFIDETQPDYVSVSGFDPFPGSYIYNHCDEYGIRIIDSHWEKHAHLIYRFSDHEEVGFPFEYEKENPWGRTFTRSELIDNIHQIQQYLREHGKVY